MAVQRVLALISGKWNEYVALQTSAGSGSAGNLVALNASGVLDLTILAFTSGSTANGKWRKEPDGQIEQRGEVTLSAGTASISFPISFTSTDIHVDLTPVLTSSTASDPAVYLTAEPTLSGASIGGSTTTVGVGATVAAGSFKVRWRAVGT